MKATEADISRVNELLARARVALVVADRARDLRGALVAVRAARSNLELLAVTMRQLTPAVEEATQDAQRPQDAA